MLCCVGGVSIPINNAIAILLNNANKSIRVRDYALKFNVSTAHASAEFGRLVKLGIAKRHRRGYYILCDKELALKRLKSKHNKHNKGIVSGIVPIPPNDILIRPHNITLVCRILNDVEIKRWHSSDSNSYDIWRRWDASVHSRHWERLIELGDGMTAKVRYSRGVKRRTITIWIEGVMIAGGNLDKHLDSCRGYGEEVLRELNRENGFLVASINLTCQHHFAVPMPVEAGWRLPRGIIPVNQYWWIDTSQGFPELETSIKEQMKRLVEMSNDYEGFKGELISRMDDIRKTLRRDTGYEPDDKEPEGYG